jgi:hypothetical protein
MVIDKIGYISLEVTSMLHLRHLLLVGALLLTCNHAIAAPKAVLQFQSVMPSQSSETFNFQITIKMQNGTPDTKTISSTPTPTPQTINLQPGTLEKITWWSSSSETPKRCETRDAKTDINENSTINISFTSTVMQGTTQTVSGCEYVIE